MHFKHAQILPHKAPDTRHSNSQSASGSPAHPNFDSRLYRAAFQVQTRVIIMVGWLSAVEGLGICGHGSQQGQRQQAHPISPSMMVQLEDGPEISSFHVLDLLKTSQVSTGLGKDM